MKRVSEKLFNRVKSLSRKLAESSHQLDDSMQEVYNAHFSDYDDKFPCEVDMIADCLYRGISDVTYDEFCKIMESMTGKKVTKAQKRKPREVDFNICRIVGIIDSYGAVHSVLDPMTNKKSIYHDRVYFGVFHRKWFWNKHRGIFMWDSELWDIEDIEKVKNHLKREYQIDGKTTKEMRDDGSFKS